MAITPHIEAEAKRTIEGIQDYYKNYSDSPGDFEEMEHRIARVERLKEACNGFTEKEKLQATAENLFEVGSAWERGSDEIKKIIKKNNKMTAEQILKLSEETKENFKEIHRENNSNYDRIQTSLKDLANNFNDKFEEARKYNDQHFIRKDKPKEETKDSYTFKGKILNFIDRHFLGVAVWTIVILAFIFISGHTDILQMLFSK